MGGREGWLAGWLQESSLPALSAVPCVIRLSLLAKGERERQEGEGERREGSVLALYKYKVHCVCVCVCTL